MHLFQMASRDANSANASKGSSDKAKEVPPPALAGGKRSATESAEGALVQRQRLDVRNCERDAEGAVR